MSALRPIATAKADISKSSCLLYPQKQTCAVQLGASTKGHVWTYMDPARLQQVDGIRFNGHNC
jgi:hypothetical protein